MGKRKMDYVFIICIIICICLLFCMETKKNFTFLEREKKTTSPESTVDKTEGNFPVQIPDSWKEEIDLNNRIDATVNVSENIRKNGFRSANAVIKSVDREGILQTLENYYHPQKGIEDEQVIQYLGEDNMYLYFFKSGEVSLTSNLRNYISMAYHEELTEDYNRDLYPVDKDLGDFPIDECDKKIGDIFETIGVQGELVIGHRTLDYKILEKEAEELHDDGTRTKPDYKWSMRDNSYYCTISQACNGLAVIPDYCLKTYANILNESGHIFLLNKERIVSFYINSIYDIQYDNKYEKLMEFSEILEKYKQYVSIARQDYETVVTDITMRAIAVEQENEKYQIVPVWIFYGYWEESTENVTGSHAVFINAVTGERL